VRQPGITGGGSLSGKTGNQSHAANVHVAGKLIQATGQIAASTGEHLQSSALLSPPLWENAASSIATRPQAAMCQAILVSDQPPGCRDGVLARKPI